MKRIETVDALRGAASLSVCWFHMTNGYPEGSLVRASGHFGWLGLQVFFVISGFIIPYTLFNNSYRIQKHWGKFIAKRVIRLDPPYFVSMLVVVVLWYLSSLAPGFQGSPPDFSWVQIALHVGYLNGIFGYPWLSVVYWTLALEFQFYLLISLIFPAISNANNSIRRVSILVLSASAFILSSPIFVFHWLCLFSLGILSFQFTARLICAREYAVLLGIVYITCALTLGTLIATVGLVTSLAISFVRIRKMKFIVFLGAISYSLYLLHVPIGGRVVNLGKRLDPGQVEQLVISVVAVFISIAAAYILYRFVEWPAQKWSSSIKFTK